MQKKIGSIFLVAGTCIGSGMIALPMVMVKIGILPGIFLMLSIWAITYYTSLISLELNLQAGSGQSLGSLGRQFSGPLAEWVGVVSLKLLSYALLAVFLYGGSSILQKLLALETGLTAIASWGALAAAATLLLPIKLIDYMNRILFVAMISVVVMLLAGLAGMINCSGLPLVSPGYKDIALWQAIIPVVFTSFGFQVIFHTLTNYCNRDAPLLKSIFLWGSLIPAVVYIIWTCSVIGVVHHESPGFYQQMVAGKADVGDLIKELGSIASGQSIQLLVWWISLLAIITSILGVGVGLCDSLKSMLASRISDRPLRNIAASALTVLPAYCTVVLVPNAFIAVLGFAGMILVVIAILQPLYLLQKIGSPAFYYPELKNRYFLIIPAVAGIMIIGCELRNIWGG